MYKNTYTFSILCFPGNGLILILLIILLHWTCLVHGGFPGRGPPPPPRGPPLLSHHPLAPGGHMSHGHSRNSPFGRRHRPPPPPPHAHHHPHHHNRGPPPKKHGKHGPPSDLAVAAQTLYDLRGYHHIPLSGPDTPRYHRQNDPFTLPTPLSQNPRERPIHHLTQDTRTAPLVFPSFYQEQPTPTPTRSSIFGHNQHLSQTRFEPPGSFHLGGNSASTKITLEQQSSSTRDQFRPSQIDISLHNNQVLSTPIPSSPSQFPQQHQIPSSLAPERKNLGSTTRTRTPVKLSKNHQQDPFAYIYDEVDYDEGEDSDFTLGGGRAPQGQINSNRITPSTSTTTVAPLRSREPTIVTTSTPFPTLHNQQQQPQYLHQNHQALYSTSTTTKQPTTTQNNIYYNPQKDDFRDPFRDSQGIIRPPVTPRPNVEINPSSERKPPPDQSNAIVPALSRLRNEGRDYNRGPPQQSHNQIPLINDNFRRPVVPQTTSTTTFAPPPQTSLAPQYQRESIYNIQPQGRQVNPTPSPTPVPYFPAGLDRRPFETQNEIPTQYQNPVRNSQTQNHFDQVVNILQEEEEQYRSQNNNNPAENQLDQGFHTPSKLRPVNTLVPKNRIPKEDILLPPNFQFTHNQDNTTPLVPINHQQEFQRTRGDITQPRVRDQNQVTRIREEKPQRIRDEVPRVPVRESQRVGPPTQTQVRSRPSVIFQDEYEDDSQNFINNNQHHTQVITESPPPPSRSRGRQPTLRTTTTTTPAPEEQQVPQRTRTVSPRQRLRPNYTRQQQTTTSTTTTTTTTTPAPTYVEYPSQEYIDDYENPQQLYQQSPSPPQVAAPIVPQQTSKPLSRFPPFPNKNKEPEITTTTTTSTTPQSPPLQRQRPQVLSQERPQGRQRGSSVKGNRFRELTTQDITTSPRTTGKPLYTTGKMLAKEGGLYAGQRITSSHVYGQPIPNIPINSVLDKLPGVLDGRIVSATTKPSYVSTQKHLRSKQRPQLEHGPPKRIRPTARPLENTLDIVETVTLRPVEELPKRIRAGNQFIRGQQGGSQENGGQSLLPKRRKIRPGQRRQQQQQQQQASSTGSPADPYKETVSIHPPLRGGRDHDDGDEVTPSFQTERAQIIREPSVETTTSVSTSPRSRRPRPPKQGGRPNFASSQQENVSERSRESSAAPDDQDDKPQKPVRKLRPRLRTVAQLSPQQQRGLPSEVVTQSQSAQVDRKPTDAPGRFSSRFRDDEQETSTVVSSSGPSRFSPPASRPTFKPPPEKKQPRNKRPHQQQQQQQQHSDGSDELPDSIKLSPKDVIANRKPARRIPPGSASDRLKALQQRRNKVFGKPGQQQNSDGEETAEGRQVPVTKQRPRLKSVIVSKPAQPQEDGNLPQPQRLRTPGRHQSQEATGSKREIVHRVSPQQNRVKPSKDDVDYYNNNKDDQENDNNKDDFEDEDNSEYTNDEQGSSSPPSVSTSTSSVTPQTERPYVTVTSRPVQRPHNIGGGFHRNKSVEVTSDEARSVLGIPRPAAPNRAQGGKRFRLQQQQQFQQNDENEEDEEQEEEQEAERQQFRQRPRFSGEQRQRFSDDERPRGHGDREVNTHQPDERQLQRPRPAGGRPHKQQQQRPRQRQQRPQEEEEDLSEYRDEDDEEDKEEPPRKPYLQQQKQYKSTSNFSPSQQILRKKLNTSNQRNTAERVDDDDEENDDAEDDDDTETSSPSPSSEKTTVTSTSTSSTSTSTSSSTTPFSTTTAQAEKLPVALPVRSQSGPQPIKQGVLKARLRPNRRLNGALGGAGPGAGPQPRVSLSVTTTEATITTTETRTVGRDKSREERKRGDGDEEEGGLKHGTIHVSKSPRPRHHGGGSRKRKEKKFIAMATENPSLPLESMFPETS